MKTITKNPPDQMFYFRRKITEYQNRPGLTCRWLAIFLMLVFCQLLAAQQTYIVTKTVDSAAGGCQVGDCSLRSAIAAANADGVASIIKFDFTTGSAPYTIFVRGAPLPPITAANTIIDGMLDNGYAMGDVIIDGRLLAGTVNGLDIMGTGTEIYGLQIQNFSGNGIQAAATFAAITIAVGTLGKGNILVDNGGSGFFTPFQINAGLDGNFIGTNPAFDAGLGNGARGIHFNSAALEAAPVFIITNSVIADNATGGILIDGKTAFNIRDNIIGTNAAANADLGNGTGGIVVLDNTAGFGIISNNTIAYSGRGISIAANMPATITENQIFCNTAGGIVRNGNTQLVDITAASVSQISGTSNVAGGIVEVFVHDLTGCSTATPCQGKTLLGTTAVTGGNWSLDVNGLVAVGDIITATVTQGSGPAPNTSVFAACQTISCPVISANIDVTPSCIAANSGSLTANPSGGIGPYTFAWSNGATTATISNLPPATYSVTILDTNACRALDSETVTEIEGPTANAGPDQELCFGNSTTLTATATGGTGPYTFTWDPGGNGPTITVTPDITTVYNVSATDSRGCTDEDQVIVRITGPQPPDAGPDQTLCADQPANLQGSIGGAAAPGPGIWSASVTGGSFSPDATALNATYTPPVDITNVTLTLTTTNGPPACPDLSDEMTITYTPGLTVDAGPDQTLCTGSPATLQGAIGGTGVSGGWSASVAGGTFSPDNLAPNAVYTPPVGIGSVILTLLAVDASGLGLCPDVRDQMTITYTTGPQPPDAGPDQTLCADQPANLQGSIGGAAAPGPGIWSASVTGGSFSPDATARNATYTPPTGIASVTLTLSTTNGTPACPDLSDEMIITYTAGPMVDAGPDQTLCIDSPATLQGAVGGSGSSGGWTASIAGGNFVPDNLDPNAVYTPPAGTGSVVLTLVSVDASGFGCPDVQDQMTITYAGSSATADAGPDQVICAGETLTLAGTVGGSATGSQWSTDGDGNFSDLTALNAVYTPGPNDLNNQGATLILTANGDAVCPPATDDLTFRIQSAPAYTVSGTDPSTCGDPDGNFTISGLNPGEAYELTYIFAGIPVDVSQDASPTGNITVDNLGDGTYSQITLTNGFGCSGNPATIVLNSPDGPQATSSPNPICLGSSGNVVANVSGGTAPYTHLWTDMGSGTADAYILNNTTSATLTVDAAAAQPGSIDLLYQVTDSNGCTATLNVSVAISALPEIASVQLDSASGAAIADGQIQFDVSNGQAPYNYSWTGPSNGSASLAATGTATIGNLLAGQYSLQLQDANACLTTLRFRIGITPSGGGGCTTDAGSLQVPPEGSLQVCSSATARLTYNGDGTLDADDVLVFVLKTTAGAIIKVNSAPEFDFDPTTMTLNTTYSTAARAGNPGPGSTVDPADPCLDESNAVDLVFRASITGVLNFIQGEETLCQGEELILSTNDLGTIDYFWITPGRDTQLTNEPMLVLPNIQPEDAGAYYVIARNGDCLNDQTGPFDLIVNGLPVGTPICAGDDQTVCERRVDLQACDTGSGTGVWTSLSGAVISNSGSANTTATELVPGENSFVWTVTISDCGSVGSDTVRVLYESALFAQPDNFTLERANTEIFMDVLKNDNITGGANYELTALTEPAFGILQTLSNGFRFYETEMRRGTIDFVYQICYFGGTCAGTCDTATVTVEVLNLPYLPQGITPDGDGRNDELTVLGYTPGDSNLRLELTIVNQWGEVVFHALDYTDSEPWNGTFGGQPVPQGAYYCHLKTVVPESEPIERTQTVYVVR